MPKRHRLAPDRGAGAGHAARGALGLRRAPAAILRRLATYSRKNRLYFAFRELGRAIRTDFLLRYLGSIELRRAMPIPGTVLRLGPDHPSSLAWLWEHWGTTQALRHVAAVLNSAPGSREPVAGGDRLRLTFWSADWTPWCAFSTLQARWPALRFEVQPVYEPT